MPYRRKKRHNKVAKPIPIEKKDYGLILVPVEDIPACWPLVESHIAEGLVSGDDTSGHLFVKCARGEFQLWIVWSDKVEAAGVTSIAKTRHGLHLQFESFAGDGMDKWFDTQDQLYAWAKAAGCGEVRLTGRRGWERVLHGKGFEMTHVILRKRLD
jgi:hypothetical protein